MTLSGPGTAIGSWINPETDENKAPPFLARLYAPDCSYFWFDFHRRTNLFAVLLWFLMALWSSISIVAGFCFFTNSPVSDCGVYVKKDNWWYCWWRHRLWWLLVWCWALVFIWCLVGGGTLLGIGGAAFLLVFGPGRVNIERQDKIQGHIKPTCMCPRIWYRTWSGTLIKSHK